VIIDFVLSLKLQLLFWVLE